MDNQERDLIFLQAMETTIHESRSSLIASKKFGDTLRIADDGGILEALITLQEKNNEVLAKIVAEIVTRQQTISDEE